MEGAPPLVVIESMHPHGHQPEAEELYAQKGCAPLRTYLDAEGGETAMGRYAEITCRELASRFRQSGKGQPRDHATYIAAFGQPVFINATAHAVACAAGAPVDVLDAMLDIDLSEAEGMLVPLFGGPAIQHLSRPP